MEPPDEHLPLLPPSSSARAKLGARRYPPEKSAKARGKQRAVPGDESGEELPEAWSDGDESEPGAGAGRHSRRTSASMSAKGKGKMRAPVPDPEHENGRAVSVIFSGEGEAHNLEVWVDEGESVASVKDKIRHLRPSVAGNSLRLIHAGRLLTDGILLLPWLRSLEERVRRQAEGVGAGVNEVLREVGLELGVDEPRRQRHRRSMSGTAGGSPSVSSVAAASESAPLATTSPSRSPSPPRTPKVYLHCNVGPPLGLDTPPPEDPEPAPRRRGFDTLLDAGLSPEDVAAMRREFYESRGEEVPDLGGGDVNDEHARALEEQWIEGDLTPATATTTTEGMFTSIMNGLLIGFLLPLTPWFFFRDLPLPNFFDADAEADELARRTEVAERAEDARRASAHAAAISAATGRTQPGGEGTPSGNDPIGPESAEPPQPQSQDTLGLPLSIDTFMAPTPAPDTVSSRVSSSPLVGAEAVAGVVFGQRMQIGIVLGMVINGAIAALRFLN